MEIENLLNRIEYLRKALRALQDCGNDLSQEEIQVYCISILRIDDEAAGDMDG